MLLRLSVHQASEASTGITVSQVRNPKVKSLRSLVQASIWMVIRTRWGLREQPPLFTTLDGQNPGLCGLHPSNYPQITPLQGKNLQKEILLPSRRFTNRGAQVGDSTQVVVQPPESYLSLLWLPERFFWGTLLPTTFSHYAQEKSLADQCCLTQQPLATSGTEHLKCGEHTLQRAGV